MYGGAERDHGGARRICQRKEVQKVVLAAQESFFLHLHDILYFHTIYKKTKFPLTLNLKPKITVHLLHL